MPTWIVIWKPATGKWQVIKAAEFPAYKAIGWELWQGAKRP